jgi:hypothetical protein
MTEKNKDFPSALQASLLVLALFVVEEFVWAAMHDAQGVLSLTRSQSDAIVIVLANGCLFAFILDFKGLTYRDVFHPSPMGLRETFAFILSDGGRGSRTEAQAIAGRRKSFFRPKAATASGSYRELNPSGIPSAAPACGGRGTLTGYDPLGWACRRPSQPGPMSLDRHENCPA